MITKSRNISEDFKDRGADRTYCDMFAILCKNINVSLTKGRFIYFIDENYVMDTTRGYRCENLTPAYNKILEKGLRQMKYPEDINEKFCRDYNSVIDSMIFLVDRILEEMRKEENQYKCQIRWFENLKEKPAAGFEEAIQRMLFVNQLFWQTDHRLTGLGAWDTFLIPFYEDETARGLLTKEKTLDILKELFDILHRNFKFKSNVLMGDSGQIFVLGRTDENGAYICNDLTYLFIDAMREVQLPEPKCLLRVNRNTPKKLIECSLTSIATGIGAPLFANDDIIIPRLIEFGISPDDARQYTTSACWEPLIGGKSTSMNNMSVLNFMRAFDNLLKREPLERIQDFNALVDTYLVYLRRNMRAVKRAVSRHRIQYNPLLSIFMDDCYKNKKDISWGGARYHHIGITSVAMGNVVNALFAIRDLVFDKKEYSLTDVKKAVILNFSGYEVLQKKLKDMPSRYGMDNAEVIGLVNRITECAAKETENFRSYLGGKLKFGLSGSAYLDAAKGFGASFDGRNADEPFIVHISNEGNSGFTEIINFASQMNYTNNRFNGNVVDLMVSPNFINDNWEKFVEFLMMSIRRGFFEMQMNVVSSQTLIEAKEHPEQFPNLIVRVWGFSAYFKDLPDDYKNVLIERAQKSESAAG